MLEIIEELNAARGALYSALDRYIGACSTIRNCCVSRPTSDGVHQLEELAEYAANELLLFSSYESKLKKAKAAMSVARNYSPTRVPINTLPSAIMSHIFYLALNAQDCIGNVIAAPADSYIRGGRGFPEYPDLLSLVCCHWRQMVMASSTLWSHIDIVPFHHFSERLLIRAKAYAARAGQALLDIHIADSEILYDSDFSLADISRFLISVATRIRSLELIVNDASVPAPFTILNVCFANCVPGTFTRLRIKHNKTSTFFIKAYNRSSPDGPPSPHMFNRPKSYVMHTPQESLEAMLLPMTSLQLSGMYPQWTSTAYHGLTALHLFPWGALTHTRITESQLIGILMSSPRLKVLLFNLEITQPLPEGALITPVHLEDLEVLNLRFMSLDQLEMFLRWLSPGFRPLQLALQLPVNESNMATSPLFGDAGPSTDHSVVTTLSPTSAVRRFFERSNVTTLYLSRILGDVLLSQITELLSLTPHLRILVLESISSVRRPSSTANAYEHNTPATPLNLDHLYMLKCSLSPVWMPEFQQMLEKHPVQQLTLWDCSYYHDSNSYPDVHALRENILKIFPTARFLTRDEPNPIDNWDLVA